MNKIGEKNCSSHVPQGIIIFCMAKNYIKHFHCFQGFQGEKISFIKHMLIVFDKRRYQTNVLAT